MLKIHLFSTGGLSGNQDLSFTGADPANRIFGNITKEKFDALRPTIGDLAVEHKIYKFFNDIRLASFRLSVLETYELPKKVEDFREHMNDHKHKARSAIVAHHKNDALYYLEKVFKNRGLRIEIFHSTSEASNWLNKTR